MRRAPWADTIAADGQPRPSDRARQLLPAPRARRRAHARRGLRWCSTGPRPPTTSWCEQIVARLHLVPRYRQRLAFVPLGQGRPVWVDDPHFNIGFHVRHTALPAPGRRGRAARGWPAASSPRRSTAAGRCGSCGSSRASPTTASRCCPRPTTRSSTASPGVDIATVLFDTSPDPMPVGAARARVDPAPAARPTPSCSPTRCSSARRCPAEIARGVRAHAARPAQVAERLGPSRRRRSARWPRPAPGRPAEPVQRAHRPPPALHLGARRPRPSSRRSRTRSAARSTTSCWRRWPARSAATCAMHGEPTDGSRAARDGARSRSAPTSSAARSATAWPRCGRRCRSALQRSGRSGCCTISREMDGIKESGQAVGAQVLTELTGFAPADDHGPGRAPAGPPADVQPGRHQRPRAAVPALHARPPAGGDVPDGPAGRRIRRSGSRS